MRRGEPRKLAPLTRSRGMIAASLLVAAVVAAYASLAMLSLSASTSGIVLGAAANVEQFVGSVGWHQPGLRMLGVKVLDHAAGPSLDTSGGALTPIDFGRVRGRGLSTINSEQLCQSRRH